MKTSTRIATVLVLLAALGLLGACNLPTRASPQDSAATAAAETVSAQLTQISQASPTLPPTNTPVPTVAATDTPPPTAVPASPTPGCTDDAQFVSDVTVPDDTNMTPGQAFSKTWRLRNSGTCAWNTQYDLVFLNGNGMGGPASAPLAGNVAPGGTVDVSVNLTAPSTNGTHRGNWQIRNEKDVLFGVVFYVQIVVGPTPTPPASTYKSGKVTVNSSFTLDLETGASPGGGDTDVWYEAVSASERYLTPQNGATFKEVSGAPEFSTCQGTSLGSGKIDFATISVGDWFCYKTNAGRFGRFEVEGITASSISIDFRTWK